MFKRTEESRLTSWYFEVDKHLLLLVLLMILVAIIIAISSGSANFVRTAGKVEWYGFFVRMIKFSVVGIATMIGVSMASRKTILNISWIDLIVCFVLLLGTLVFPHTINMSRRWFVLPGVLRIMPSDLMKPGFIIITAWFFDKMKSIYGKDVFDFKRTLFQLKTWSWGWYLIPFAIVLGILYWHPDLGTMGLFLATFGTMLLLAGLPMRWVLSLAGAGIGFGFLTVLIKPHALARLLSFLGPIDPTSQVGIGLRAIRNGGLFGAGDKADIVEHLAMAESDFVLSVISENFGAIASCGLIFLLLVVVVHLINQSKSLRDEFASSAVAGTAAMFGFQCCINLASTLRLMPAKGMTLPFISHGGSSFVCYCLLFGMVLALIREDKWK